MDNNQLNNQVDNNPVNNQANNPVNAPVNNTPVNNNPVNNQANNNPVNTPANNTPVNNNPANNQVNNQAGNGPVNDKEVQENEKKGRGMFYGIVAVAIFIIMAVGATYAYFTASTRSTDQTVTTKSAKIDLEYFSYNEAWMRNDLIPTDTYIAEYSFENQDDTTNGGTGRNNNILCKDDNQNSTCSVYVFQVRNTNTQAQTVSISLESNINQFQNLHAMIYRVAAPENPSSAYTDYSGTVDGNQTNDPVFRDGESDETEGAIAVYQVKGDGSSRTLDSSEINAVYINRKGTVKTLLKYNDGNDNLISSIEIPVAAEGEKARLADNVTLPAYEASDPTQNIQTFAIVLYIKNLNTDQTIDDGDGKEFAGTVYVSPGNGDDDGVKGVISMTSGTVQSNITPVAPTASPSPTPTDAP